MLEIPVHIEIPHHQETAHRLTDFIRGTKTIPAELATKIRIEEQFSIVFTRPGSTMDIMVCPDPNMQSLDTQEELKRLGTLKAPPSGSNGTTLPIEEQAKSAQAQPFIMRIKFLGAHSVLSETGTVRNRLLAELVTEPGDRVRFTVRDCARSTNVVVSYSEHLRKGIIPPHVVEFNKIKLSSDWCKNVFDDTF